VAINVSAEVSNFNAAVSGNRATHRQPRNGTDTISTGRAPAKQHRYNLNSYTHAAAVPYIVSIEALVTSKQGKIKLPEDGLDRLKHVGVVGSILTK